jgi:hypothetical protein
MSAGYAELPTQAAPAHFEIFSLRDEVHWRLLSRNNRVGGQSSAGFADAAACRLGVARLLDVLPELQAQHVLTQNRWNWALILGNEVLARSSHSFDRRIRCMAASDWFYRTAPLAGIRDGLRVVRVTAPGSVRPADRVAPPVKCPDGPR